MRSVSWVNSVLRQFLPNDPLIVLSTYWLNLGWVLMSWVSHRLRDQDNCCIHLSSLCLFVSFSFCPLGGYKRKRNTSRPKDRKRKRQRDRDTDRFIVLSTAIFFHNLLIIFLPLSQPPPFSFVYRRLREREEDDQEIMKEKIKEERILLVTNKWRESREMS